MESPDFVLDERDLSSQPIAEDFQPNQQFEKQPTPLSSTTIIYDKPNLLTLPPEIRLQILSHLLILPPSAPPPSQNAYFHSGLPASSPIPLYTAILRTNRKLHAEALPLLYRHNTFLAHPSLLASLPRLRRAYAPVLSCNMADLIARLHVCIRLDAEPRYDSKMAATQLSGREEIVLETYQVSWRGSGPDALRLFEGVRGVRRARVVGSVGGFEDYARWLEGVMMCEHGTEVKPFVWDGARDFGTCW
ncbi:uncharacterized protein F4822DRAFT_172632 [Hypoxylon trugodes]|uniref:uncharacterized protein n=1 Tax=Hypoxylon trugodes TaxID=326681 RepID=UPI00218FFFD2|nr:uncharacterized protein F4822DRAFT_172632 [Hypoxylon trugodes]KAI1391094.1 hypothetical protein F4822DRAFT_172632 [Hypoxylon trugodes]